MQIGNFIASLEEWAPPSLQEDYDNCGLLTGDKNWLCKGVLISLDANEAVVSEAISRGCNLIITHHPVLFKGLKKITGSNYTERTLIKAIKNDIALYAIHTNLDNVIYGVNKAMANKIQLTNYQPLIPKKAQLKKLFTFVPEKDAEKVRSAIFSVGAGHIGNYSETSFNTHGTGTFKPGINAQPAIGTIGNLEEVKEIKIEVVFPAWLQTTVIKAMKEAHPYEEVAYDIVSLDNDLQQVGTGLIGSLPNPVSEQDFLHHLKKAFGLSIIRHTAFTGKMIQRVALCGGAGSFLTKTAISHKADAFITADVKYHEFFDADEQLLLADIGHWESEQFTIELLHDFLKEKFPTFAVLKSGVKTNPVEYFS